MSVSSVCQACGLCCDGSLFTVVPLGNEESVPAILPVIQRADGSRVFRQRCAALTGTRCTVYDARPSACQRHECLLFDAMASKEITAQEALEVVRKAKELIAARSDQTKTYLTFHFGRQLR